MPTEAVVVVCQLLDDHDTGLREFLKRSGSLRRSCSFTLKISQESSFCAMLGPPKKSSSSSDRGKDLNLSCGRIVLMRVGHLRRAKMRSNAAGKTVRYVALRFPRLPPRGSASAGTSSPSSKTSAAWPDLASSRRARRAGDRPCSQGNGSLRST